MVPVREGPGGALTVQRRGCDVGKTALLRRDAPQPFKDVAVCGAVALSTQRDDAPPFLFGTRYGRGWSLLQTSTLVTARCGTILLRLRHRVDQQHAFHRLHGLTTHRAHTASAVCACDVAADLPGPRPRSST